MTIKRTKIIYSSINNLVDQGFANLTYRKSLTTCKISRLNVNDFKAFVQAIEKVSRLNLTRTSTYSTACKVIMMFYVFQLAHNSKYVRHLYTTGRVYVFPDFVHSMLLFIAPHVVSANKITGFIEGDLSPDFKLSDVIEDLVSSDDHTLVLQLLTNTCFATIVSDCTNRHTGIVDLTPFIEQLKGYIVSVFDKDDLRSPASAEFDAYSCILSEFRSCLYYGDNLDISSHRYTSCESETLGIYRWHNDVSSKSIFKVQQSTVANVGLPALKQHSAFLRTFYPTFSSGKEDVDGEIVLDFSLLTTLDAWTTYFNCKISSRPPKGSDGRGSKPIRGNRTQTSSLNTEPGSLSSHISDDEFSEIQRLAASDYSIVRNRDGAFYVMTCEESRPLSYTSHDLLLLLGVRDNVV
jgi:hypothetical protein